MKLFRDPLTARIMSGLVFAAAFIWVAVYFFNVDLEVIKVFLVMSFIFVGGLIVLGLLFSLVIHLLRPRRKEGLLDSVDVEAMQAESGHGEAQHDRETPVGGGRRPDEDAGTG